MVCAPRSAQAAVKLPAAFERQLRQGKLSLDLAELKDFEPARVLPNPHFEYDFAVRHQSEKLEIRYAIRSMAGKVRTEPQFLGNDLHVDAVVGLANMARQTRAGPEIRESRVPPNDARDLFNADWALFCRFRPHPAFASHAHGLAFVAYSAVSKTSFYMIYLYFGREEDGRMSKETSDVFNRVYLAPRFN
jgi:hypothetical protein